LVQARVSQLSPGKSRHLKVYDIPAASDSGAMTAEASELGRAQDEGPTKNLSRMSTGYGRSFTRCNMVSRVVIFGCLGMALFGYDTGIVSGAMILVTQDIPMDTQTKELVVSITMLFAAISTVFGIPANSLCGRKPVIMGAALLYMAGSAVIALADGVTMLVVGRALLGAAIGFASGTVPMYSAELSPPEMRGMIVTLNDLNIVFGQLLAAMMNVAFKHVDGGWRWSMGLAAAPALLLFAGFVFLPESPRWLAMKDRLADAEGVLRLVHGRQDVTTELNEILKSIRDEGEAKDKNAGCSALMRRGARKLCTIWGTKEVRRAAILGIGLMGMNQLSGINTVMYYSTTILVQAGFSRDASIWLAALCCLAQLLGVCVSVASMDSFGRRPTALRSCGGVVVTLMLLATSFWCTGELWDNIKVGALMAYLIAFGSGLSGVPWVINAEIYPLKLRSAAVGQATFFNWGFNWLVGNYFLSICELFGTGGAFTVFAGFSVVGGIWLFFMLPETMGLELEAIAELFTDPYPKSRRQKAVAKTEDSDSSGSEEDDDSLSEDGVIAVASGSRSVP